MAQKGWIFLSIALMALLAVLGCAGLSQEPGTQRISIAELKSKLDGGERLLLIDVREDWELNEHGAIRGAIHIPVAELDARMKDIPKDVTLVFY